MNHADRSLLVLASAALSLLAGCTTPSRDTGWQSLFNGHDLSGWVVKCRPADAGRVWWRVEKGAITADSMGAGKHDYIWLVSEDEFDDFVLQMRFQAFRDSPGNSGVQIRSRYDDAAGWLDGPQVDLHPPGAWRTGMVWDETRGNQRWLWPSVPRGEWVAESMANPQLRFVFADTPPGWNELEITARGTRLAARLNGVQVMDYDGAGVLDDAIHQARGVGRRGHIALQVHSGDQLLIRYKDIRIKRLDTSRP